MDPQKLGDHAIKMHLDRKGLLLTFINAVEVCNKNKDVRLHIILEI